MHSEGLGLGCERSRKRTSSRGDDGRRSYAQVRVAMVRECTCGCECAGEYKEGRENECECEHDNNRINLSCANRAIPVVALATPMTILDRTSNQIARLLSSFYEHGNANERHAIPPHCLAECYNKRDDKQPLIA